MGVWVGPPRGAMWLSLQAWLEWEPFGLLGRKQGAKYLYMFLLQCLPKGCVPGTDLQALCLGGAIHPQGVRTTSMLAPSAFCSTFIS